MLAPRLSLLARARAPAARTCKPAASSRAARSAPLVAAASTEDAAADVSEGAKKLFVGNIPWAIDSGELSEMFAAYGTVESADVIYDRDGRSRGFGFVVVSSNEDAKKCVDALNSTELGGRTIVVDYSASPGDMRKRRMNRPKPQDNSAPGTKLFVANLSYAVDDEWLTEIFEQAGEVREATVVRDDSGRSRGFGFVTMSNVEAASEAETKIHGEDVDGRDLRVELAGKTTRKGPRRDRGGGGGGWGDDAEEDDNW